VLPGQARNYHALRRLRVYRPPSTLSLLYVERIWEESRAPQASVLPSCMGDKSLQSGVLSFSLERGLGDMCRGSYSPYHTYSLQLQQHFFALSISIRFPVSICVFVPVSLERGERACISGGCVLCVWCGQAVASLSTESRRVQSNSARVLTCHCDIGTPPPGWRQPSKE